MPDDYKEFIPWQTISGVEIIKKFEDLNPAFRKALEKRYQEQFENDNMCVDS